MPSISQRRGQKAEDRAAHFLERSGLVIVSRNISSRYGEIDIVARERDGTLVCVEVKMRTSHAYGTAAESITERKIRKLRLAAQDKIGDTVRLDAVVIGRSGVHHLKGLGEVADPD